MVIKAKLLVLCLAPFTKMAMVYYIANTNRKISLHIELDEHTKTAGFVGLVKEYINEIGV